MIPPLTFFCEGKPAPGGSKTFFPVWRRDGSLVTEKRNGRIWPIIRVVDDAGEGNKAWRAAVAVQARAFMKSAAPFTCAIKCEFIFFLRRPQNHYRTGKFAHMLRDDAPAYHITRPDALKLARSTEDALTGILWRDDGQNIVIRPEKRYMTHDEKEGVAVKILLVDHVAAPNPVGQQTLL
jgi:Holliday junction resolvase RusA-like endonuclease